MCDFIDTLGFARFLFDRDDQAQKAVSIIQAILEARPPRLSDISQRMPGKPAANYKAIQRFLDTTDPRVASLRVFREDAPFVIGDPTETPRPQAHKTAYVGLLKDTRTLAAIGNTVSRAGDPLQYCDLFLPHHCRQRQLSQPGTVPRLC
jgi:hypothetical protein